MAGIVVVGAGLAGLACAWRLKRQGHAVRVLERAPEAGGRVRTLREGRFRLDAGTPVVTPGQRRVLALAREVGVLGALRPLAFGRDLRWQDEHLVPASPRDWLALARRSGARAGVLRVAFDFQRPARVFDPGRAATPEDVTRSAAADALGWWPCAPDPWEAAGIDALRTTLSQAAPHAFAGGMGTLSEALAARLEVVTDCNVLRIESDSEGARVAYRLRGGDRHDHADAVVVAVPATRVAALCPKLAPEERGFFELARSEPGVIVHLLFDRAPRLAARSVRFGAGGLETAALCAEHVRAGAAPLGAGALRVSLSRDAALRMFRASDASIADLVLENLAYSPVGALSPEGFRVSRHADLAPRFDEDHARRLARFHGRLERSPRLAFAGDALAGPSADGAVASGLFAAREVAAMLSGGRR